MDNFSVLEVFVRVSEVRSFTAAGNQLGVSSSAISKAISRLEEKLRVRLFHRSTRTVTLTPEGTLFLKRCRRILNEIEAAENELSQSQSVPSGKLKVSMPSIGVLFMPKFAKFSQQYPEIELEIDSTDGLVDLIEEGFDAVIRTGEPADSRLMARVLGSYKRVIVGSPTYFQKFEIPKKPEELINHFCMMYRYKSTGKLDIWPINQDNPTLQLEWPTRMVTNTLDPLVSFAENSLGITCIPDLAIREQLKTGKLITILNDFNNDITTCRILWPSSKYLSPKLRVFINFMVENLFKNE
ncbi:LysR substrate-binding domain-containing protein [Xenorhabdus bovienii]|uniref:LysR substrate-binding domain-containing protein n=1 Tax=Xenorhabdus bovienii TaxID=40576 RepID=UPI0023B34E93|nr:LysR substrate-binding domain-containing protein [Xenorhabdus bovienii]MDE9432650.1 LysR family transcriptional regulator [Xenorhabdus bovienii]MDE9436668.1 LysR family transcriptional regulator [Xenorhabdus bovienii]MDE9461188.1 LysR family transcriptional regulator [Xenorhabdus bovienii]MDE9465574.1 LysR family transcriptional regulator [Xenorhabdus bovienii]MDE9469493.1 LysR family transcriptional regulator [Xenorhabdus bovienii]